MGATHPRSVRRRNMSTKIFTAWKLPEGQSPFDYVPEIQEAGAKATYRNLKEAFAEALFSRMDTYLLGLRSKPFSSEKGSPAKNAYDKARKDVEDRDSGFWLAFLRNPEDGSHYVIGPDKNTWRNVALDLADRYGWEDYHYQNSTDKPDDVAEEDWEERKRVWDVLLPGAGVLERHSLIVSSAVDNMGYNLGDFGPGTDTTEYLKMLHFTNEVAVDILGKSQVTERDRLKSVLYAAMDNYKGYDEAMRAFFGLNKSFARNWGNKDTALGQKLAEFATHLPEVKEEYFGTKDVPAQLQGVPSADEWRDLVRDLVEDEGIKHEAV